MKKRTPAQQQYHELKQQNPESVLLFRMGDFYETFHEDAHIAHKVLGITLTARDKKSAHPIPMAGIPHHALDRYLPKFIDAGYKVAIAEQVGEVIPGRVVRREVTQRITPGTYLGVDDDHTIIAVWSDGERYWTVQGVSGLGQFETGVCEDLEGLFQRLMSHTPREIVLDIQLPAKHEIERWANQVRGLVISISDTPSHPRHYLLNILKTSTLDGYGKALEGGGLFVMSLLVQYLITIQGSCVIQSIGSRAENDLVHLDPLTLRNLEVFTSQYEGSTQHSLVAVIDHCQTVMGTRLLHHRLRTPTRSKTILHSEHDRISSWIDRKDPAFVRQKLATLPDLTKIPARLQRGGDHQALLRMLKSVAQDCLLDETMRELLIPDESLIVWLQHLVESVTDDEMFFVEGYDTTLDRLREVSLTVDDQLMAYHQKVVKHTGLAGVRVKYTGTQGYCLEVSKKDADQFLNCGDESQQFGFFRRQSLKSAERFGSPALTALENTIAQAQEAYTKQFQIVLSQLVDSFEVLHESRYQLCRSIAQQDLALAASVLIQDFQRILPTVGGQRLDIVGGRHPVVEKFLSHTDQFIPNDLSMDDDSFHLITGPNMGGKSTYLRQNALIILLAQAGLPVPATSAVVPLVDGIYARVGSGDALAKNQSTFMTEMIEMANIINNATRESFIVLDELGRGTSTYDGMSLAHALTVHICHLGAKTLFATHYHELIYLEKTQKSLSNYQVSVIETDREVVFMKKIIAGGADKSYGLHVARLAGIPDSIVDQAQEHLQGLHRPLSSHPIQHQLFDASGDSLAKDKVIQAIQQYDLSTMTPIDALVHLDRLKRLLATQTTNDSA